MRYPMYLQPIMHQQIVRALVGRVLKVTSQLDELRFLYLKVGLTLTRGWNQRCQDKRESVVVVFLNLDCWDRRRFWRLDATVVTRDLTSHSSRIEATT